MDEAIRTFIEKRDKLLMGGGAQKIAKQHEKGKLTARERLALLFDEGSFVEYGLFVRHRATEFGMDKVDAPSDGVVTGFGTVGGRIVYAYAQDATVVGGSLGEMHGIKIVRLMEEAIRAKRPIVALNDSGGARIQEGVDTKLYLDIFNLNIKASGYVPQLTAIMGPCAGGGAYSPALTDFIINVEGTSRMFVTGPSVVKSVTGEVVDDETLGGAKVHSQISGVCHAVAADDEDCIEQIKQMLSFLPDNCLEKPPVYRCDDDPMRLIPELDTFMPEKAEKVYDVHDVIRKVVDAGYFYEIQPDFARNIVVGLARMDGRSVGIIANQPLYKAGSMDMNAADKAAHFINFCDSFGIALIFLSDVPGCLPGVDQEYAGVIRHGAKMVYAVGNATVPKIALTMRKMYGGASACMCEKGMGPDVVITWPTARCAVMGAAGAAAIVFRKEIAAAENPAEKRRELTAKYEEAFNNPYRKAEREYCDMVILPSETRRVLIQCLRALENKQVETLPKKHGNMPV